MPTPTLGVLDAANPVYPINRIRNADFGRIVPDGRLAIAGGLPKKNFTVRTTAPRIQSIFGLPIDSSIPAAAQEMDISNYSLDPASTQAASPRNFVHFAVATDPRYGETPYRSPSVDACLQGQPDVFPFRPAGVFECYRLILFAALEVDTVIGTGDTARRALTYYPHQAEVLIVTEAFSRRPGSRFDRLSTQIRLARFMTPFKPMKFAENMGQMEGFELSATADGRFFAFKDQGQTHTGRTVFSFNERPWEPDGWLPPVRITQLHSEFRDKRICILTQRPCTTSELLRFSIRYRLVQKPFFTPEGAQLTTDFRCDYPWLSLDGSELYCQLHHRDTLSVMGYRTKNIAYLIDGPLNPKRKFIDCPEDYPSQCPGVATAQSLGNSQGIWPGLRSEGLSPFDRTGFVTSLLVSGNSIFGGEIYGEVNFSDLNDGNYLVRLPMNELVEFGDMPGKVNLLVATQNAKRTPDLSGNFHRVALNGALFPDECWGEEQVRTWTPDEKTLRTFAATAAAEERWWDKTLNGFNGRGIYFPDRSQLRVKVLANSEVTRPQDHLTIEIAVNPHRYSLIDGSATSNLASKAQSWRLYMRKNGTIGITIRLKDQEYSLESEQIIPLNAWTHVAATFNRNTRTLGMHLNGIFVRKRMDLPDQPVAGGYRDIVIGPNTDSLTFAQKTDMCRTNDMSRLVYTLDEFSLSRTRRGADYLREKARQGYNIDVPQAADVQGFVARLADEKLPLGLSATDLRLPAALSAIIRDPARFQGAVSLGRDLFKDPILSTNGQGQTQNIACASCHRAGKAFTDGLPAGRGVSQSQVNTPTTMNRAFSTRQFFDGRAANLVPQALGPVQNPIEMNGDLDMIVKALKRDTSYRSRFGLVFGEVSSQAIAKALAAFELTLLSGNSEYDDMVDRSSEMELDDQNEIAKGAKLFFGKARCAGCHSGSNFADEAFHATGTGGMGRAQVTGAAGDYGAFKTPTLRNIALTGPYFHDGSVKSLREVVNFYTNPANAGSDSDLQPIVLSENEKTSLVNFLCALTDQNLGPSSSCP